MYGLTPYYNALEEARPPRPPSTRRGYKVVWHEGSGMSPSPGGWIEVLDEEEDEFKKGYSFEYPRKLKGGPKPAPEWNFGSYI